jgi:hypothetical protein
VQRRSINNRLHESELFMTPEPNLQESTSCRRSVSPHPQHSAGSDLVSPVLYDLVLWGFTERNCSGQRVLRQDIQARLDGLPSTEGESDDIEPTPLYVGYRCQACWEAAVTLVTYGQHLCAWNDRLLGTPHQGLP